MNVPGESVNPRQPEQFVQLPLLSAMLELTAALESHAEQHDDPLLRDAARRIGALCGGTELETADTPVADQIPGQAAETAPSTPDKPDVDPTLMPRWLAVASGFNLGRVPRHEAAALLRDRLAPYSTTLQRDFTERLATAQETQSALAARPRTSVDVAPKHINHEKWRQFVNDRGYELPTRQEDITDGSHTITTTYLALQDANNAPIDRLATITIDTNTHTKSDGKKPETLHKVDGQTRLEFDEDGNIARIDVDHTTYELFSPVSTPKRKRYDSTKHIKLSADLRTERLRFRTTDFSLPSESDRKGSVTSTDPSVRELTFSSSSSPEFGNQFEELPRATRRGSFPEPRMELTTKKVGEQICRVLDTVLPDSLQPPIFRTGTAEHKPPSAE